MTELVELAVDSLRSVGVELREGMSESQLAETERKFGFTFSPDHREFLSLVTPVGEGWWNWRVDSEPSLRAQLEWPIEGSLYDVEHNGFWLTAWGEVPEDRESALAVAEREIRAWPALIPIWGHRFMPAAPLGRGAPVFSVFQTDVIYYGDNLLDYFHREFAGPADSTSIESDDDAESLWPWSKFAMGDGSLE